MRVVTYLHMHMNMGMVFKLIKVKIVLLFGGWAVICVGLAFTSGLVFLTLGVIRYFLHRLYFHLAAMVA